MKSPSVDRCIAIAAHGRRCQQTTYRGSPYCWHHTQSRKVWAPSRVSSRRSAPGDTGAVTVPESTVETVTGIGTQELARQLARHLSPAQVRALATFLRDSDDGVFRIEKVDGALTGAHRDARLSRALKARVREADAEAV